VSARLWLSPPTSSTNRVPIILIAAITSQKTQRVYPFEVLIEAPEGGLRLRSKVMLMHLRSVDKKRLSGRYGAVTDETMARVEEALKIATGLVPV